MGDSIIKYAFIYPGQGSQALSMGKSFRDNFKIANELMQRASEALKIDMANILDNDEEKLNTTQYTQPAILLVSSMAHNIILQETDIRADIAFGHSLGEVSAYCLNGGASFEDSIILAHERGKYMADACGSVSKDSQNGEAKKEVGMLVSLGLKADTLESICEDLRKEGLLVWVANYNLDTQIVLAGIKDDLKKAEDRLKAAGAKRAILLKMSTASHCPLLESSIPPFKNLLQSIIKDCSLDVISNATLDLYKTKEQALENLTNQLIKPVFYNKSVLKAKDLGVTNFIELGHGSVLAGLNNKISDIPTISINSSDSIKQIS